MINPEDIKETDFRLWAKNEGCYAYQTGVLKSDPKIKVGFVSDKRVDKHTDEPIMMIYSLPKFNPAWQIVPPTERPVNQAPTLNLAKIKMLKTRLKPRSVNS